MLEVSMGTGYPAVTSRSDPVQLKQTPRLPKCLFLEVQEPFTETLGRLPLTHHGSQLQSMLIANRSSWRERDYRDWLRLHVGWTGAGAWPWTERKRWAWDIEKQGEVENHAWCVGSRMVHPLSFSDGFTGDKLLRSHQLPGQDTAWRRPCQHNHKDHSGFLVYFSAWYCWSQHRFPSASLDGFLSRGNFGQSSW